MVLFVTGLRGQTGTASFSNLRYKTISSAKDSVVLDTLSIAEGSLSVRGVPDSHYYFFPYRALLVWKQKPAADSVDLVYRVLPVDFNRSYFHKHYDPRAPGFVSLIYKAEEGNNSFLSNNRLDYNGSFGRSITLGNNQDVVLNSQFNLQANGYILDSIKLEAAIADNTIPFQPEGNTQRLQEFDQVYIRLSKNRHYLQLGDYSLEGPPGYFLKFFKRVQGLYYQTGFALNKSTDNRLGLSGSVSKGQFARNIFQGQEGNQGPYKLTGNNGEQFFIVLAGTERVYVDNVLMERGENADYIINYNTAEVRFMPRKMITKDSRIQVEFEYQDRNYLNSLIYAWDELQIGKKWNVRLNMYSNQDAKNQPYLQNLSGEQKRFLSGLGDSIQYAFYPSIATDTFAPNKVLYKITDTTVAGISYDSVFVYSTNPDSALYNLSFSFVGAGRGNYVISTRNANGRVYDWVAPVDGVAQGSFAPVQLLVTPKKQQVFILTANYQIDSLRNLNIEAGASNTDPNLFSKKDDGSHWGLATKVNYKETRLLGKTDSAGIRRWTWQNQVSYEFVQDRFKAIAPFRNVEFGRDWNVAQTGDRPDEHLVYLTTKLSNPRAGAGTYQYSYYQRGSFYTGYRNILGYEYNWNNIKAGFTANLLNAADTLQRSSFFRPAFFMEYRLMGLGNMLLGASYSAEHNELRSRKADTLLPTAFSFDISSAYIRSAEGRPANWSLTYFIRRDRMPRNNEFLKQNHSNNAELKLGLAQWKDHRIDFTGSYRKLIVDDTALINLKPEETLLGRLEYTGSMIRQAVSLNTLYEFGSGQEQKRSYTFVEVPAGQGIYTWVDYNADSVQQANEFEVALYPDQKRYIRVFTPTNDYVKVNYVNFNLSLTLEPSYLWKEESRNATQRFLSRLSTQSALQVSNRLLADEGLNAYNPFVNVLNDTSIILTNTSFSTSIFFNRSSVKWGIDYNLLHNTGKQLLVYGVEGSESSQHQGRLRWNVISPLTINLTGKTGKRAYRSALVDNRSYEISNWSAEPSVTWLYRALFRVTATGRYEMRLNLSRYGGEEAKIQSFNLELRYSKPATGVIQLRGMYANIEFNGLQTSPVAFTILDALQKGSNYLWFMTWERRVGKGIEVSLEYEGRKPGTTAVIHTGRMSIRAIL